MLITKHQIITKGYPFVVVRGIPGYEPYKIENQYTNEDACNGEFFMERGHAYKVARELNIKWRLANNKTSR